MATTFLEPGGDADFLVGTTNGFWTSVNVAPTIATDFVHGNHLKSIKYAPNSGSFLRKGSVLSDAGSRISLFIYIVALPTASKASFLLIGDTALTKTIFTPSLTNTGVLQLWNNNTTNQIGSNGSTLSTGVWYRISIAYTITSTSVNEFRLFVNGVLDITATNATLTNTGSGLLRMGNSTSDATLDFRSSDHYIDDSSSLTDTGNIWVTAKRPNANGTTNNFNVQIGAGGSGYGSGHSPQVNERPLSTTNGWSVVAAGATTEEYNIESKSTGDIDISTATIVDYTGWVSAKALVSETASIVVNNATSNIALTSTITLFTKIAGSSTYPAGTGTDIGIVTDATATTVSLYESGVLVAFIPAGIAYTLSVSVGTFILTGISVNFTKSLHLIVSVASFVLTGIDINLIKIGQNTLKPSIDLSQTSVNIDVNIPIISGSVDTSKVFIKV